MENTLIIYIESKNETWEMPDDLALSWNEFEKEHPVKGDNSNADDLHQKWFDTLTPEQQAKINKSTPQE